ncbi:MAG TPA: LuxR C-terminal-related transcriptional regulator [Hyphomonas sp.]|nr:autoinducer binding domain-containing protein [Hyphomonas sp.]MCB9962250.1 autoinducer binding domain-containing protein [Hyphomonas sp.]HPE46908.1 LuxR C-terminal-related transcriptional regulator [Hyphomonas sp.]
MLDLLRALLVAESVLDLRDATMSAFAALGFNSAYFLSPIVRDRRKGRLLTNIGFPDDWEQSYRDGMGEDDPLPDLALQTGKAFRWAALPKGTRLQPGEVRYLDSLAKWGMADGIAVAAYGSAARVGFVGIGGPTRSDSFAAADLELLRIAGQMSYMRYCELIVSEASDEPRLSSRELDVLHWMAQGKSNAEIARRLGVGRETVDTYVRRIFVKFDVSDRTSAVVKGVSRGLVVASDRPVERAIRARQPKAMKP